MADYPFKADSIEREWRFTLTDPILECNQGAFRLCISQNGQGRADFGTVCRPDQYSDDDHHADGI